MSESSFDDETFEGAEDSDEPTGKKARSAFAVLKDLHDEPFEQVVKYRKYAKACDNRKKNLFNLLSEDAVELLQKHGG